jgi:hypothetical protein
MQVISQECLHNIHAGHYEGYSTLSYTLACSLMSSIFMGIYSSSTTPKDIAYIAGLHGTLGALKGAAIGAFVGFLWGSYINQESDNIMGDLIFVE